MLTRFHKFQNNLVTFLSRQFDSMENDKKESIKTGCFGNCDTLHVVGFDNNHQYHIILAVQYVCDIQAAYINWFAVEHQLPSNATFVKKGSPGEKLKTLHNLGLGEFMLSLIQMQQVAKEWKASLVLQINPNTMACAFYKQRGF
jgi:hypothetical protein